MSETRVCRVCGNEKHLNLFQIQKGKPTSRCRDCGREYWREWNARQSAETWVSRIGSSKVCPKCGLYKPVSEFGLIGKGKPRYSCDSCNARRVKDWYQKKSGDESFVRQRKAYLSEYKERNRERINLLNLEHRKNNWERYIQRERMYRKTHKHVAKTYSARIREELTDGYIKNIFRFSKNIDVPNELLSAKRMYLKINRLLKEKQ